VDEVVFDASTSNSQRWQAFLSKATMRLVIIDSMVTVGVESFRKATDCLDFNWSCSRLVVIARFSCYVFVSSGIRNKYSMPDSAHLNKLPCFHHVSENWLGVTIYLC
jgi:hypothetical protein